MKKRIIMFLIVAIVLGYVYYSLPKSKIYWLGDKIGVLIRIVATGKNDKGEFVELEYVNNKGTLETKRVFQKDLKLKRF